MYVVKADVLDLDGNIVGIYVAADRTTAHFTMRQCDALRYDVHPGNNTAPGFRVVKLVKRSRS